MPFTVECSLPLPPSASLPSSLPRTAPCAVRPYRERRELISGQISCPSDCRATPPTRPLQRTDLRRPPRLPFSSLFTRNRRIISRTAVCRRAFRAGNHRPASNDSRVDKYESESLSLSLSLSLFPIRPIRISSRSIQDRCRRRTRPRPRSR